MAGRAGAAWDRQPASPPPPQKKQTLRPASRLEKPPLHWIWEIVTTHQPPTQKDGMGRRTTEPRGQGFFHSPRPVYAQDGGWLDPARSSSQLFFPLEKCEPRVLIHRGSIERRGGLPPDGQPHGQGAGIPLLPPISCPPQSAAARVKAVDAGAFGLIDWGIGVFCGRLLPPFGGGPFPKPRAAPQAHKPRALLVQ